jgi:lantibiotic modifying enzyme
MQNLIQKISTLLTDAPYQNIGLLCGLSGDTLFFAESAAFLPVNKSITEQKLALLEQKLQDENCIMTHCSGLAGIGWLFEYLSRKGFISEDTNELLSEFDQVLSVALQKFMIYHNYDFLHGGTGVAIYFLQRVRKNPELLPVLNRFIVDLHTMSETMPNGTMTWRSVFEWETGEMAYNLSLSHGMAATIWLLTRLSTIKGLNQELVTQMLHNSIAFVLEQELDRQNYFCYFPSARLLESDKVLPSRLGWCYGDLGIATTLYQAGKTLNRQDWINKAMEILLYTAEKRRDLERNAVKDAGLCHGTAGIGHIFYRMWLNTHLPEFKQAADYWFEQTLKMARFSDGLAGYKTWHGKKGWQNEYSFLEGIAGIGLALMSYYYEIEPSWDECLLLS